MRFGSWTFDAHQVRLKREKKMVNLEDYLPSGTWDVIEAPGTDFSDGNRMELVYTFKIRRKTLFYTVNLIIPTVLISFLSIFVFYLPTDEGEKMTLCISILLALVVFLLLVSKILPPTSMVIPLISKYLIFTLMMNIITILNTVIIINWNYRTPRTHNMPKWVRIVFINFLPKVLLMTRPEQDDADSTNDTNSTDKEIKIDIKTNHSFSKENSVELKQENYLKLIATSNNKKVINYTSNYIDDDDLKQRKLIKHEQISDKNRHLTLLKQNDVCSINSSIKHDIPIPIITSNLDYYSMHQQQQQQQYDHEKANQTLIQRPKQQQHKNLDKLVASLKSQKRLHLNNEYQSPVSLSSSKLNHIKLKLYTDDLNEDDLDENRNRLLTLSATDSICTTPQKVKHRHRHHHKHRHENSINISNENDIQSNNNRFNYQQMNSLPLNKRSSNNNLVKRVVSNHNRRQQYAQSQSRSLEYALDDSFNSEDDKPIEFSREIMEAADKVTYITNHIKSENYYEEVFFSFVINFKFKVLILITR